MVEPTTQVRHVDVASGQRGRSEDHGGMLVVALPETARQRAQALAVQPGWVAPISTSGLVKPKRFSYTVSCTIDRPLAWVRGHHERLLPVGHEPGCTSVSIATGFKSPPGCQKRMPLSVTSDLPPTLRNTLRNVIISGWVAPLTEKMSPCVASAADA